MSSKCQRREYTAEHPEEAGKIVYKEGESATEEHQIAMTKKVVEFVAPDGDIDSIGKLDSEALHRRRSLAGSTVFIFLE